MTLHRVFIIGALVLVSGFVLTSVIRSDVGNRSDIQIGGNDVSDRDAVEEFFSGYELLLVKQGFELEEVFKDDGSTLASIVTGGNLMTCRGIVIDKVTKLRGVVIDNVILLKCSETWAPSLLSFWPRVSKEYRELMAVIAYYIEPFGVEKIERLLYNSDRREMNLSELKGI